MLVLEQRHDKVVMLPRLPDVRCFGVFPSGRERLPVLDCPGFDQTR